MEGSGFESPEAFTLKVVRTNVTDFEYNNEYWHIVDNCGCFVVSRIWNRVLDSALPSRCSDLAQLVWVSPEGFVALSAQPNPV